MGNGCGDLGLEKPAMKREIWACPMVGAVLAGALALDKSGMILILHNLAVMLLCGVASAILAVVVAFAPVFWVLLTGRKVKPPDNLCGWFVSLWLILTTPAGEFA